MWHFSPFLSSAAECFPYDAAARHLFEKYREAPAEFGVTSKGGLIQLFLSPDKTWTLVSIHVTEDGHKACVIAGGYHWEAYPGPKT